MWSSALEGTPVHDAFSRPGPAALGAYHPANTFRTPFYRDRRKATAYARRIVRVLPQPPPPPRDAPAAAAYLRFLLTRDALSADALLSLVFVADPLAGDAAAAPPDAPSPAAVVVRESLVAGDGAGGCADAVAAASLEWRPPAEAAASAAAPRVVFLQEIFAGPAAPQQQHPPMCVFSRITDAVCGTRRARGGAAAAAPPASPSVFAPPWFFQTAANKFFHLPDLGTAGAHLTATLTFRRRGSPAAAGGEPADSPAPAPPLCCGAAAFLRGAFPPMRTTPAAPAPAGAGDPRGTCCCDAWRYVVAFAEVASFAEVDRAAAAAASAAPRLSPLGAGVAGISWVAGVTQATAAVDILSVPGVLAGVLVRSSAPPSTTFVSVEFAGADGDSGAPPPLSRVPLSLLLDVGGGWRLWTTSVFPESAPTVPPPGPMLAYLDSARRGAERGGGLRARVFGDDAAACSAVFLRALEFGALGAKFSLET